MKILLPRLPIIMRLKLTVLLGIVVAVTVLSPVNIQLQKPAVSANVAHAALLFDKAGFALCGHLPDPRCVLSDVSSVCQADLTASRPTPNCTEDDKTILKQLASCDPSRGFFSTFTDVGTGGLCSDVQKQQSAQAAEMYAATVTSCSGINNFFTNPVRCTGRLVATTVSSILISVAAWALAIAGVLFNWTLMNTVILFKDVIFGPIENGINIGWTAFRDISNIVIIGVFTFIAISIILGNKEFGQKKLVARVLVIAILINFSLLFTKLIIDASNFTAGQFYAATQGGGKTLSQVIDAEKSGTSPSGASGVSPFSGYSRSGIAGQFVNFLGVTSIADTYVSLKEVGERGDSGWLILVHALFAMVLLLGAAIVLFYGSFLLISRAIILIFLLLTSAIAFASHLIPKMSDGNYDAWGAWWKSLLGSAVLAPLLMIFLYITLQIASSLKANNGTLGNLISGSATGGDINALFAYLIVLGLLFGSFKLASSFSAKIGGFNFAAMVPAIPLALGARATGFLAKQSIGRVGTMVSEGFAARAKEAAPGTMRRTMFDMTAQTFKKVGKSDFNVANTGFFGKEIAGMAGLKGVLTGQTKTGGFEGYEDRLKKRYAERAERTEFTDDELKKKRGAATKAAETSAATETGRIAEEKNRSKKDYQTLQTNIPRMKEDRAAIAKALQQEEAAAENQRKISGGQISRATEASLAEKQSAIQAQDARIKEAESRMGDYETKIADLDKQEVTLKERQIEEIAKALPKGSYVVDEKTGKVQVDREGNVRLKPRPGRVAEDAITMAHQRVTNLPWVYAGQKPEDDRVASKMRKTVTDQEMSKNFKKQLAALEELTKEEERAHRREERRAEQTREHQKRMEEASHAPSAPPRPEPGPAGGTASGH